MQIDFFSDFYKKKNSTKRPVVGGVGNLTEKYTVSGVIKEPSDVLNPVIDIQNSFTGGQPPTICTYAYIPRFGRYYFVKDWTYNNALWTVKLETDVLATYKDEIGELDEYILRHDSDTDYNGYISDNMYPATNDFSLDISYIHNVFTNDITVGCYVVGIISGDSVNSVGAITYYAMNSADFGELKRKLFSNDNLQEMGILDSQGAPLIQDISVELLKTLYDPYQYIASCMWFPFPVSAITSKTYLTRIPIGWWEYPLAGYRIYAQELRFAERGFLEPHPQASTRGQYLNYAPYTRRTLIGRFGTVPIDSAYFKIGQGIDISYLVDIITGRCIAEFNIFDHLELPSNVATVYKISAREFMLGVPIQLAQVGVDYLGTAVTALNSIQSTVQATVQGASVGGAVGGIAGGLISGVNGIYDTIQSAMPQVETGGTNGSFLAGGIQTEIINQYFTIVDENIHHKGRPLCEVRKIKNLSGFIVCGDGDIDLSCYDNERDKVSAFMTTGFFWE